MAETVVRRKAIIQAGGVGDVTANVFRFSVVLNSYNLAIPPAFKYSNMRMFVTAGTVEATLKIVLQSGFLALFSCKFKVTKLQISDFGFYCLVY